METRLGIEYIIMNSACPLDVSHFLPRSESKCYTHMTTSFHVLVLMSAYAQAQAFSPIHSSLHFPLTSPPLHIPPRLESPAVIIF